MGMDGGDRRTSSAAFRLRPKHDESMAGPERGLRAVGKRGAAEEWLRSVGLLLRPQSRGVNGSRGPEVNGGGSWLERDTTAEGFWGKLCPLYSCGRYDVWRRCSHGARSRVGCARLLPSSTARFLCRGALYSVGAWRWLLYTLLVVRALYQVGCGAAKRTSACGCRHPRKCCRRIDRLAVPGLTGPAR